MWPLGLSLLLLQGLPCNDAAWYYTSAGGHEFNYGYGLADLPWWRIALLVVASVACVTLIVLVGYRFCYVQKETDEEVVEGGGVKVHVFPRVMKETQAPPASNAV
ncbi:unnamed protein product [Closterium sp. NIES-65]|nr:unnamed protein product [Closterium sp. NIES-65]